MRLLAAVAVLCFPGCAELRLLTRPASVLFQLRPLPGRAGGTLAVSFEVLDDRAHERYEVCLEPDDADFYARTHCVPVPTGVREVKIDTPEAGAFSVRVLCDHFNGRKQPQMMMVAHRTLTIER